MSLFVPAVILVPIEPLQALQGDSLIVILEPRRGDRIHLESIGVFLAFYAGTNIEKSMLAFNKVLGSGAPL